MLELIFFVSIILYYCITNILHANSKMEITPAQFVEKYKLVPKQMRFRLLEFVSQQFGLIYDDWNQEIFDDAMNVLRWYENTEEENYTLLRCILEDDVYLGPCFIYDDIIKRLLSCLNWSSSMAMFMEEDVQRFRHKNMLREIRDVVAYRPGNPGYERSKEHFESLLVR